MVLRLARIAPDETAIRLDDMSDKFRVVLGTQLKETSVKHEIEKDQEAKRGAVKSTLELARRFPDRRAGDGGRGIKWVTYLNDMSKDHAQLVKEVEKEMRERLSA